MLIELEPSNFNRSLLSIGFSEFEVRELAAEFSKNNFIIDDELLLEKMLEFGKDMYTIISVFDRLGLGKGNAVKMLEQKQRQKLGNLVNIYSLEVDD
jgi:hypothetical protein